MNRPIHTSLYVMACAVGLLSLISVGSVYGQISTIRLSFHHLSPSDGLSEGTNAWIYRDKSGFTWISSLDGLNRFDGRSVKTYRFDPSDRNCLADNIVTSTFFEDDHGDLWFTTYSGINVYRRQFDHFETFRLKDASGNEISEDYFAFHLNKDGKLWVRTGVRQEGRLHTLDCSALDGKIVRPLRGQRLSVIQNGEKDVQAIVSSLISGGRGIILTPMTDEVSFASNTFFSGNDGYGPATTIYNVYVHSMEEIWLGAKIGLIRLNPINGQFQIYDSALGVPLGTVRSVVGDGDLLYVGSTTEGIFVFDKSQQTFLEQFLPNTKNDLSLRSRRVSKLYIDNEDVLWASYFEGGSDGIDFAHLKKNRLPILGLENKQSYQAKALAEDAVGNVFVAVGNALYIFDKNRAFLKREELNGIIRCALRDNDGRIWLVARDSEARDTRLYRIEPNGTKPQFILNIAFAVRDFYQLKNGRFLIATESEGVQELKEINRSWTISPCQDMPEANNAFISRIQEDHSGQVYVSINFDRLLIYEHNEVDLKLANTISKIGECKSFYFLPDTSLAWIAASIGLISLNTATYDYKFADEKTYNLPNKKYFNLVSDGDDHLWLRAKHELLGYSLDTKVYSKFTAVDGLEEVAGDFQPGMIDRNGFIWMAGKYGVNVFHPDSLLSVSALSKPQITAIQVNDAPHELPHSYMVTDSLELDYSRNTVTFEFVACAYADPNNINFEYRLLGQDVEWIQNGQRGYVRFNKLPFGNYTFQVKTVSADLSDSDNITEVFLRINPPIWATPGAYILYVFMVLGIVGLIRLWERNRQKKKIEEEQRKVAQEKRINNELRKIDKLKDQFLANTSHELRTPLNGIIGLAESLVDGATGKLPGSTVRNLKMISSSGKRLASLVNDILDFSKLKTDSLNLNLQPVDLYSASEVVLTLLEPLKKGKDLKLINRIPRDIPLIEADENRIQQILYNLIGNAIKFTEKGQVTLKAMSIENSVSVTITDTGIGIRKEKFQEIFQSFQQADGSETRGYSGAGLGLSVTKQLVELHGGEIFVDSEIDKGSSFTFSMPISSKRRSDIRTDAGESDGENTLLQILDSPNEKVVDPIHPNSEIEHNRDLTILVVDDEPVNREVLKNQLTTAGYSVVLAANGQEALDRVEKVDFNLIILDIMMPGMSGNEVCKVIREKHPPNTLPIIMLTAKNTVGDLVKSFTLGANDYLAKPFSKDELLTRIKTHINLHNVFHATGKFVPYEFLNAIGRKEITDVRLGDHAEVEVTVMFTDIRDFTRISESMSPTENFKFVNDFVGRMGPIIQKNKGFVNQYLGDGMMAIFPDNSEDALRAAVEMLEEINRQNKNNGVEDLSVGIGLHTGPLIMGIIGDENRTDPATIADTVNTSSRLEGLTKHFRTKLIVSADSIADKMDHKEFHYRSLGKVRLKGKKELIDIYECVDGDVKTLKQHKISTRPLFEAGLQHYYKREFHEAVSAFKEIVTLNHDDTVAQFFLEKCIELERDGIPKDWTGVEEMTSK